jgi:hypothetical protein
MAGTDIFKKWSEMLGKPEEEIKEEFVEIYSDYVKQGGTEEDATQFGIMQLKSKYLSELRSRAVWWDGLVVAKSEPNYYHKRKYDYAKKIYKDDPAFAVDEGLTDDIGEPLDTKEFTNAGDENPNFEMRFTEARYNGKKFDECAIANVYGVARKIDTDEIKIFRMPLFHEMAELDVKVGQYVKFRALDRDSKKKVMDLGAAKVTEFIPQDVTPKEFDIEVLIDKFFKVTPLKDLETWHDINETKYDEMCLIKGMINSIDLDGDRYNRMTLDDLDSLDILDEEGETVEPTFVQVPKDIKIDFGERSIMYAFGRTWRGKDREGNEKINFTAQGIFVPDRFKLKPKTEVATKLVEETEEKW